MACPPTCGAAAALFVRPAFARRHGLRSDVRIAAQAMTTDRASTFKGGSMMKLVGSEMAREAADAGYDAAGVDPSDIRVCELHDCFAQNEPISYEALRLCGDGEAAKFVDDATTPMAGASSPTRRAACCRRGPPLGATGLAQCFELTYQLRGITDARQVDGANVALQHNQGLGGACAVTLDERV